MVVLQTVLRNYIFLVGKYIIIMHSMKYEPVLLFVYLVRIQLFANKVTVLLNQKTV